MTRPQSLDLLCEIPCYKCIILEPKPMPSLNRLGHERSQKTPTAITGKTHSHSHTKNPSINHNFPAKKKKKRQSSSKQHTVLHSQAVVLKHGIKSHRTLSNTLKMDEASTTPKQEMGTSLRYSNHSVSRLHILPHTAARHKTATLLRHGRRPHSHRPTNMEPRILAHAIHGLRKRLLDHPQHKHKANSD